MASPARSQPELTIIVPVYNERQTLPTVLEALDRLPIDHETIVIDNVSTDGTREFVTSLHGRPGVVPVLQQANLGKGSSVRVGLALAQGEYAVVQDADLEYDPRDILRLLAHARASAQTVLGSRLLGHRPAVPWHHALGRDALNVLFRLLYRARITDVATCYKLLRTDLACQLPLESLGFDLDYELPCRIRRANLPLTELPVSYSPRTIAQGKKLTWTAGMTALRALLRCAGRPKLPSGHHCGQVVQLTAPPFGPCEATVEALRPGGVQLAFTLHGRPARATVPVSALHGG